MRQAFEVPLNYWDLSHLTLWALGKQKIYICIYVSIVDTGMMQVVKICLNGTWWPVQRPDSRFAPSQWETLLQCNAVSHWLGANLEFALSQIPKFMGPTWGPAGSCRPQMGPMNLAIRGVHTAWSIMVSDVLVTQGGSQGISSHCIDLLFVEYSGLSIRRGVKKIKNFEWVLLHFPQMNVTRIDWCH